MLTGTSGSPVTLRCGRYAHIDKSVTPKPVTIKVTPPNRQTLKVKVGPGATLAGIGGGTPSTSQPLTTVTSIFERKLRTKLLDTASLADDVPTKDHKVTQLPPTATSEEPSEVREQTTIELEEQTTVSTNDKNRSSTQKYTEPRTPQPMPHVSPTVTTPWATTWFQKRYYTKLVETTYDGEGNDLPEFIPEFHTSSDHDNVLLDSEFQTELLEPDWGGFGSDPEIVNRGKEKWVKPAHSDVHDWGSDPSESWSYVVDNSLGKHTSWDYDPAEREDPWARSDMGKMREPHPTIRAPLPIPVRYWEESEQIGMGRDKTMGEKDEPVDSSHRGSVPVYEKLDKHLDSYSVKHTLSDPIAKKRLPSTVVPTATLDESAVLRHHIHTYRPDINVASTTVPTIRSKVKASVRSTQSFDHKPAIVNARAKHPTPRPTYATMHLITPQTIPTVDEYDYQEPAEGIIISEREFYLKDLGEPFPHTIETKLNSPHRTKFKPAPTETYHTLSKNTEIAEILKRLTTWGLAPLTPHPSLSDRHDQGRTVRPTMTVHRPINTVPTTHPTSYTTPFISSISTTKFRSPTTPDHDIRHHVHSVIPWHLTSYATGEFKTAEKHIALVDESDPMTLPPTTTPLPTTTRPTRTPEVVTMLGTLSGRGHIMATIGRRKRPRKYHHTPSHSPKDLNKGVPFRDSKSYGVIKNKPSIAEDTPMPGRQPYHPKNTTQIRPYGYGFPIEERAPTVRKQPWLGESSKWTPSILHVRTPEFKPGKKSNPWEYETNTKPFQRNVGKEDKDDEQFNMVWGKLLS